MTADAPRIDGARLLGRLAELARIGAIEDGRGACRLALGDEDREARRTLDDWMRDAGLRVTYDAIGNQFGTLDGESDGPHVMLGSHIDTVGTGGRFDGSLGVLAALEVACSFRDAGHRPKHPLTVAAFTNEEGVRYQPDMMGSLAYAGRIDLTETLDTIGIDGTRLGSELERIGYAGDDAPGSLPVRAFVELHIEQGPLLEQEGRTIGVVEGVQGISWTEFVLRGAANHAGTTPMSMRKDAGVVAAGIAAYARELCDTIGHDHRATVGSFELEPNLVNVIPRRARLTVDQRNRDDGLLRRADEMLLARARSLAAAENVTLEHRSLARVAPVDFDEALVGLVQSSAETLGHSSMRLTSGAGHDAQILAPSLPATMIFVPSRGGISHSPDEWTSDEHILAGAEVLLAVARELAG